MTRNQIIRAYFHQIKSACFGMIGKAFQAVPIAILVGILTYAIITIYKKKSDKIVTHSKAIIIFTMYISILVQMVIVARPIGTIKTSIDWVPFDMPGGNHLILIYALANAVVFIPFGILTAIIWKKMRSYKYIFIVSFVFSFCIEALQLILSCGQCQVEDLIMNSLGGVIGFWIINKKQSFKQLS